MWRRVHEAGMCIFRSTTSCRYVPIRIVYMCSSKGHGIGVSNMDPLSRRALDKAYGLQIQARFVANSKLLDEFKFISRENFASAHSRERIGSVRLGHEVRHRPFDARRQ